MDCILYQLLNQLLTKQTCTSSTVGYIVRSPCHLALIKGTIAYYNSHSNVFYSFIRLQVQTSQKVSFVLQVSEMVNI